MDYRKVLMEQNEKVLSNESNGYYQREDYPFNVTYKKNDRNNKNDSVAANCDIKENGVEFLLCIKELVAIFEKKYEIIPYDKLKDKKKHFGKIIVNRIEDIEYITKKIAEVLSGAQIEEERVNIRWSTKQLNIIKDAAKKVGLPYQLYIREASFRKAVNDLNKIKN